jgi:hypothetical protein
VAHTPRRAKIEARRCPDRNRARVRHELEVRDNADEWARRGNDTECGAMMLARQREGRGALAALAIGFLSWLGRGMEGVRLGWPKSETQWS